MSARHDSEFPDLIEECPGCAVRPSDDLPAPAGAFDVSEWGCCEGSGEGWSRVFTVRQWRISGRAYPDVQVVGAEYADGRRLVHDICVEFDDGMTVDGARALATALVEAADFVERP